MSTPTPFKVLFVDNSKTTRFVMSRLFEQRGYTVDSVGTGVEAIEKIKSGTHYDLAIMDLYMPFMNGYEAAKHFRELEGLGKTIPIIALTASTDPHDKEVALNAGMNEYIIKSDDNTELFKAIEKYK